MKFFCGLWLQCPNFVVLRNCVLDVQCCCDVVQCCTTLCALQMVHFSDLTLELWYVDILKHVTLNCYFIKVAINCVQQYKLDTSMTPQARIVCEQVVYCYSFLFTRVTSR